MRPSNPRLISNPATLGELAENINELTAAVSERIKLLPAYKARHGHSGTVMLKQEAARYLKMCRRYASKLEKELNQ
jgi:hypothetical protein